MATELSTRCGARDETRSGGVERKSPRYFLRFATLRRWALLRVPSFFNRPLTAIFFSDFEAALPASAPAIIGIKWKGISENCTTNHNA